MSIALTHISTRIPRPETCNLNGHSIGKKEITRDSHDRCSVVSRVDDVLLFRGCKQVEVNRSLAPAIDPLIILVHYRLVPLNISNRRRLFMNKPKRMTKFMTHSCAELQIAHIIGHSTVVHGWLVLADIVTVSANVRPISVSIEGDTDIGISWGITLHPFEGQVGIASPFVGELFGFSIFAGCVEQNLLEADQLFKDFGLWRKNYLHDLTANEIALTIGNSLANKNVSRLGHDIPPHIDDNF
jgi:hypothetical protein